MYDHVHDFIDIILWSSSCFQRHECLLLGGYRCYTRCHYYYYYERITQFYSVMKSSDKSNSQMPYTKDTQGDSDDIHKVPGAIPSPWTALSSLNQHTLHVILLYSLLCVPCNLWSFDAANLTPAWFHLSFSTTLLFCLKEEEIHIIWGLIIWCNSQQYWVSVWKR